MKSIKRTQIIFNLFYQKTVLLFIFTLVPLMGALAYYQLAVWFNPKHLSFKDYISSSYLMSITVLGVYQFFFWVQRNNFHKTFYLSSKLDEKIPFIPQFVWLYSLVYYFFIGLMLVYLENMRHLVALLFAGIVQSGIQCVWFYFMPVVTPIHYRDYAKDTFSKKFLGFVQKLDNGRCCFPSLHCSVMMFVSLFLYPYIGWPSFLIVISVSLSCLLVKQHQLVDFIPSIPIALGVYYYVYLPLL